MTIVSTEWLNKNLGKVKIIDASWHLRKDRNALDEYNKQHIENAIFMDLDEISNQDKKLPHNHFFPSPFDGLLLEKAMIQYHRLSPQSQL